MRAPQSGPGLGTRAAKCGAGFRALQGIGKRNREQAANGLVFELVQEPIQRCDIDARARRVVNEYPILRRRPIAHGRQSVSHRLRARASATAQRHDSRDLADALVVQGVVAGKHDKDRLQDRRSVQRGDGACE